MNFICSRRLKGKITRSPQIQFRWTSELWETCIRKIQTQGKIIQISGNTALRNQRNFRELVISITIDNFVCRENFATKLTERFETFVATKTRRREKQDKSEIAFSLSANKFFKFLLEQCSTNSAIFSGRYNGGRGTLLRH